MTWFVIASVVGFLSGALTGAVAFLLLASAWASSGARYVGEKPDRAFTNQPRHRRRGDQYDLRLSSRATPSPVVQRDRSSEPLESRLRPPTS